MRVRRESEKGLGVERPGGREGESQNKRRERRKMWLGSVNLGVRDNRQAALWVPVGAT